MNDIKKQQLKEKYFSLSKKAKGNIIEEYYNLKIKTCKTEKEKQDLLNQIKSFSGDLL